MRRHRRAVRYSLFAVSLVLLLSLADGLSAAQNMCLTGVCVLTWQQDSGTDIGSGCA